MPSLIEEFQRKSPFEYQQIIAIGYDHLTKQPFIDFRGGKGLAIQTFLHFRDYKDALENIIEFIKRALLPQLANVEERKLKRVDITDLPVRFSEILDGEVDVLENYLIEPGPCAVFNMPIYLPNSFKKGDKIKVHIIVEKVK